MTIRPEVKRGRKVWRVTYREGSRTARRFFPTKGAAEAYAAELTRAAAGVGPALGACSDWERAQMLAALHRAQTGGYSLAEACQSIEDTRKASRPTLPVGELRALFLAAKAAQGLRPRSLRGLASSTSLFIRGREAMPAGQITPTMVAAFTTAPGFSAWRHRTMLVDLSTWFSWAVALGHLVANPCHGVPRPIMETPPPVLHHAGDVLQILRTAERLDPEMVGYGAAGYLAGLRPESEMQRLEPANFRGNLIRIDKWNKTRRRRDVTICPSLAEWLNRWRVLGVPLAPAQAGRRWHAIRKAAGYTKREQDVMRHTFVSAHYVVHGEVATTAQAGHSAQELHGSYRDLLSPEEAAAIFEVRPDPAADYPANAAARMAHWRRSNPAHMREMLKKRWPQPQTGRSLEADARRRPASGV